MKAIVQNALEHIEMLHTSGTRRERAIHFAEIVEHCRYINDNLGINIFEINKAVNYANTLDDEVSNFAGNQINGLKKALEFLSKLPLDEAIQTTSPK